MNLTSISVGSFPSILFYRLGQPSASEFVKRSSGQSLQDGSSWERHVLLTMAVGATPDILSLQTTMTESAAMKIWEISP